ncbi:MAG: DUF1707 domain-containing protein [Marmoricola sp.]
MSEGSLWDRFSLDPRHAENARLRASDRDRDVVNDLLGTAYSEGRLTPEELDERSDRVAHSRTLGDLPPIIDDLVAPTTTSLSPRGHLRAEAEHRYRQQRQNALFGFITPTIICWVIWSVTMFGGFPWPAIVMVASGAKFLQVALTREDTTRSIERDLEKKERKRLEAQQEKRRKELE